VPTSYREQTLTIYQNLLARGYFPKELPPAFFTDQFAKFATSKSGRGAILKYKPVDNFTQCVSYQMARPGSERRELKIPHPYSFALLAALTAKHFGRLLGKAGASQFSKSRPIYAPGRRRALSPIFNLVNLARERAASRAGATFLLQADISHFYPSLYTHAVGWSIDPKLRDKAHWSNPKLLGKKLDQALMNLDGKISQGIPIGNDISFLLAEIVLGQVDKKMAVSSERAYRWYDDYEIAFDTRGQAEAGLKKLTEELRQFRLRLNPHKTAIVELPLPSQDEWHDVLVRAGASRFSTPTEMVKYFDAAFRLRQRFPESALLSYALGILFRLDCPAPDVGRVAQSCITQSLLCEPGVAQKAFALLSYWHLNGFALNTALIASTVDRMVAQHQARGVSSDIAWALAFCLDKGLALNKAAAQALSGFEDDCVALQSLHLHAKGLLPHGFSTARIQKMIKGAELDREHWLIAYESLRHGFLLDSKSAIKSNPLFSALLGSKVTFYRAKLPSYAALIHPGGAPDWVTRDWIKVSKKTSPKGKRAKGKPRLATVPALIRKDLARLSRVAATHDDAVTDLMDIFEPDADAWSLLDGGMRSG
jgi:hypothetical protein